VTVTIDDPADPRVADYVGLRDGLTAAPVFIAEGITVLARLLESQYPVRSVFVSTRKVARVEPLVRDLDVPLYVADESVLEATVGVKIHRGVIAAADRLPLADPSALLTTSTRVAVLEGLNDLENLGSLFRNAAAFGIDAVLLDPRTVDPLYRRIVRVSLGHVLRIPFARLEPWPDALDVVRAAGFTTLALTPSSDATPIAELAAAPPERVAFLLGAEGPGLSPAALAAGDRRVRIPMADTVDSVNVATAAALAFSAFFRPREPNFGAKRC
jgi:tRNA G18 (ribose-2'-O)-methylase SpoU